MIHEFALDPSLLNNWDRFRYLTGKFGISEGRLIARYPKHWKRMVYAALNNIGEVERKRIVEWLMRIDDKMQTRVHEWNNNVDWLRNAQDEHCRQPFHAILAQENPSAHSCVLTYDELDDSTPRWTIQREKVVTREAQQLATEVSPLLRNAKTIIFIDPHFEPWKHRLTKTLKAFLEVCLIGRISSKPARVEFHTKSKPEQNNFAEECQRHLPQKIPIGISVKIVRWQERTGGEGLHNRYILTERGGIRLAWGLDEGGSAQTDDLSLLESDVYTIRWHQYCGNRPAFDLVDIVVIHGMRILP